MRRCAAAVAIAAFLTTPAAAQTTSRPGPWVLDVRGVTSPVPDETVFYPRLDRTAILPSRGVGLDFGAHVYFLNVGAARLGLGANVFNIRASTEPPPPALATGGTGTPAPVARGQRLEAEMRLVSPQVSFNFGSRDGWSYLSAGMGPADIVTRTQNVNPGRRESGRLNALNVGGGARWFMKSHLAFTFDVRMHKIPAGTSGTLDQPPPAGSTPDAPPPETPPPAPLPPTPGKMIFTVGVGISVR